MKFGHRFWPVALGLYGAIGGGISFVGWAFDVPWLADWFGGISIQPNTAVACAAVGIALICLANGRIQATRALAIAAGLIGATALFQTISGVTLGNLDSLLRFGRDWGNTGVVAPGRMGAPSATSLILLGIALLLATSTKLSARVRCTGPAAAGVATVISTTSLVGYFFGASALYTIPSATAIALQTATFVLALSLGTILSVPQFGPGRLIYEPGVAGAMFRRMLPALVLVPLVLGFLRLEGERRGYYDLAFGTAGHTVAEMAILTFFVWLAALDISKLELDQIKIQDQLGRNESLLRMVTEEAEVGLVIIDRDHRYLYANRSYAEIIRANANEIIGKKVEDVLPEVYDWRVRPKIERAFAGETVKYELDLPRVGQFVSVTYQPVHVDGRVDRVIVAVVDTTHRRQIENALEKSRAELEVAAKHKDEFLMTLAHELRNPLAPIRTAVDIIKRTEPGGDLTLPREVIDRQLRLMVRLLDDLLDVGRIERDTLALRKERVDLATVIRHAVEISQPLADRFKHQIVVNAPARPIEVDADPARLEQVVANLLNNACRFTPAGGRIEVWVEREGAANDVAVVRVRDNGVGIAPEDLTRVFEMFEQLDRSSERAQGGLGIGLHLVKQLVAMHAGSVEASSGGMSHGSEFVVRLPALPPAIATAAGAAASAGETADNPTVLPRRILVVDDNVDAAMAMAMLLNLIGHETHIAHTGPEALDAVTAVQPDVVLLDLGLPGMSGFEVCQHIRKTFTEKPPLVVALTGWGQESDRRKSRDSGFDHHLVKPVDYEALADLLAKSAR